MPASVDFFLRSVGFIWIVGLTATASVAQPDNHQMTSTARYEVRFEATWADSTHPNSFPPNPHFSPLIGGVHGADWSLWQPDGLASPGIEAMAETGSTFPLDAEVQAAIDAGTARQIVSGGGIPNSPGSARALLRVTQEHPLVSLVTMVAPSPDWFVGVHDLDLRGGGDWLQEKVVTLFAWDAGTDSGTTYRAQNRNTSPPSPIRAIEDGPLGNGVPLGTLTFSRQDSSEPDALELLSGRFRVSADWQDFDLQRGRARAVQLQDESGYLWFFSEGNIEVVVKILDACTFNDRFWVFVAGLTNVGVELQVEDTVTGQVNVYSNNLGVRFVAIQDTDAFASCSASPIQQGPMSPAVFTNFAARSGIPGV